MIVLEPLPESLTPDAIITPESLKAVGIDPVRTRVFVDGLDVTEAFKVKSAKRGVEGWIEFWARTKSGALHAGGKGTLSVARMFGAVDVKLTPVARTFCIEAEIAVNEEKSLACGYKVHVPTGRQAWSIDGRVVGKAEFIDAIRPTNSGWADSLADFDESRLMDYRPEQP